MRIKQEYIYSLDENQCLVSAIDAIKGKKYYCPFCGTEMIVRQGKIRKWHFAHKADVHNCSYESYLHKLAKIRIRECFNNSPQFIIGLNYSVSCEVEDCPVGSLDSCNWNEYKEINLKEYYDKCEEEVVIGNYRADLLITHTKFINRGPILIEICVTHKSTTDKINSGYRIIEIPIKSEEDIERIISVAAIKDNSANPEEYEEYNEQPQFFNFNCSLRKEPSKEYQAPKSVFWIRPNGEFVLIQNTDFGSELHCLSKNATEVMNSIFRIESKDRISWADIFYELAKSGLGLRYCGMCKYYKEYYSFLLFNTRLCILYKAKGTPQYPKQLHAKECPYYRQKDFVEEVKYNEFRGNYKVTINNPNS